MICSAKRMSARANIPTKKIDIAVSSCTNNFAFVEWRYNAKVR